MADLELKVRANVQEAERSIAQMANQVRYLKFDVKGGNQPLGRITGQLGEFDKSLAASNARVIAFGASAGIIAGLAAGFHKLVESTIEVQKSLNQIGVILNVSGERLDKFGASLFNIAKNTGQAFNEVADAATLLSRQGLGVEETLKRTNDALILSRLTGMDAAKSVQALTAAVNSFASQGVTANEVLQKFATVDSSFAIGAKDLPEAIGRVGSSAAQAGVSLSELIGLVTAAQVATARGGSVIGNSFKTIFTRLQRPKVQSLLESLGVNTKDSAGEVKPTIEILKSLASTYDSLGTAQKAQVAEQVGGVFQINILKATLADLSKQYSVYGNAVKVADGATDEATKRNEKLNQTYSAQLNILAQNATQVAAKAGASLFGPSLTNLTSAGNDILGGINESDGRGVGAKLGKGILDGLGQVIGGPGLLLIGAVVLKLGATFAKFSADSFKDLLGLNVRTKERLSLEQSFLETMSKEPGLQAKIRSGAISINQASAQVLDLWRTQTAELKNQELVLSRIGHNLQWGGAKIGSIGERVGVPVVNKADGYLPNFSGFAIEEAQARALGARNPRAQLSEGTIGGQKFIKNSEETEILRFGSNGDSAVIPHYAAGFVPNFKEFSVGAISQYAERVRDKLALSASEGDAGRLSPKDRINVDEFKKVYEERKDGENPAQFEERMLRKYHLQSSSQKLEFGDTSAIDGYYPRGNNIDIFEIKSARSKGGTVWNDKEITNKFLRAFPENYGTGNLFDRFFTPNIDRIDAKGTLIHAFEKRKDDKYGDTNHNIPQLKADYIRRAAHEAKYASGYLPNFTADALTGGRNRFQINWMKEWMRKKQLPAEAITDPQIVTRLAQIFAKKYPNNQGMMGLAAGHIPNFAAFKIKPEDFEQYLPRLTPRERALFDVAPDQSTFLTNRMKGKFNTSSSKKSSIAERSGISPQSHDEFAALIADGSERGISLSNYIPFGAKSGSKGSPLVGADISFHTFRAKLQGEGAKYYEHQMKESLTPAIDQVKSNLSATFAQAMGLPTPSAERNSLNTRGSSQLGAVMGNIFEDVVKNVLSPNEFLDSKAVHPNSVFDLRNSPTIKRLFGTDKFPSIKLVDLKRIDSKANMEEGLGSVAGKIFRTLPQPTSTGYKSSPALQGAGGLPLNFARGYIPNYADALSAAIGREVGAGAPSSSIYVKQYSQLRNQSNPTGLGVFNTRDEGSTGSELGAIRRKGYASGHIPNFADDATSGSSGGSSFGALALEISSFAGILAFQTQGVKKAFQEEVEIRRGENIAIDKFSKQRADLDTLIIERQQKLSNAIAKGLPSVDFYTKNVAELTESRKNMPIPTPKYANDGIKTKLISAVSAGGAISGTALSFAPIVTSTISNGIDQTTKGGREKTAGINGFGEALSFAGTGAVLGSSFGPEGTLIGAALGGLIGGAKALYDVFGQMSTDLPEILAKAKKNTEIIDAKDKSLARYASAAENINQIRLGKGTDEQKERSIKSFKDIQKDALLEIKDPVVAEKLGLAGNSIEQIKDILLETQALGQEQKAKDDTDASLERISDDLKKWGLINFNDKIGKPEANKETLDKILPALQSRAALGKNGNELTELSNKLLTLSQKGNLSAEELDSAINGGGKISKGLSKNSSLSLNDQTFLSQYLAQQLSKLISDAAGAVKLGNTDKSEAEAYRAEQFGKENVKTLELQAKQLRDTGSALKIFSDGLVALRLNALKLAGDAKISSQRRITSIIGAYAGEDSDVYKNATNDNKQSELTIKDEEAKRNIYAESFKQILEKTSAYEKERFDLAKLSAKEKAAGDDVNTQKDKSPFGPNRFGGRLGEGDLSAYLTSVKYTELTNQKSFYNDLDKLFSGGDKKQANVGSVNDQIALVEKYFGPISDDTKNSNSLLGELTNVALETKNKIDIQNQIAERASKELGQEITSQRQIDEIKRLQSAFGGLEGYLKGTNGQTTTDALGAESEKLAADKAVSNHELAVRSGVVLGKSKEDFSSYIQQGIATQKYLSTQRALTGRQPIDSTTGKEIAMDSPDIQKIINGATRSLYQNSTQLLIDKRNNTSLTRETRDAAQQDLNNLLRSSGNKNIYPKNSQQEKNALLAADRQIAIAQTYKENKLAPVDQIKKDAITLEQESSDPIVAAIGHTNDLLNQLLTNITNKGGKTDADYEMDRVLNHAATTVSPFSFDESYMEDSSYKRGVGGTSSARTANVPSFLDVAGFGVGTGQFKYNSEINLGAYAPRAKSNNTQPSVDVPTDKHTVVPIHFTINASSQEVANKISEGLPAYKELTERLLKAEKVLDAVQGQFPKTIQPPVTTK